MTEEEAESLFGNLTAYLRKRSTDEDVQPSELLEAVEAEIAEQKPVPIKLPVDKGERVSDPLHGERGSGRRVSGEFMQRRPFTSKEKLEILLEALALTAVAPPLMSSRLVTEITDEDNVSPVEILFGDDVHPEPKRRISADEAAEPSPPVLRLHELIEEVRAELNPRLFKDRNRRERIKVWSAE